MRTAACIVSAFALSLSGVAIAKPGADGQARHEQRKQEKRAEHQAKVEQRHAKHQAEQEERRAKHKAEVAARRAARGRG